LEKKRKKKREGKLEKKWKNAKKKKRGKNIVDYWFNPLWFRCGGTVIPPHYLDIVIKLQRLRPKNVRFIYKTKNIKKIDLATIQTH
jgi:hypothetical protein